MSQTVHLVVANNVGCVIPEGKCFPCSRVSQRTSVYSCPSLGRRRIHSHVKIGGLKSGSLAASFVCEARRNPDFSRQNNRHGPSRGRNRNNDGSGDMFENFEEDLLSSKNGPLVSLASGKFQPTSSPGPREKEIVELFRKVQARLRERSAVKEEKKVEAPRGNVKEKSAVDSLLNLLKKHSAEQVKRNNGEDSGKDHNSDQLQESNQIDGRQSTNSFNSNSAPKDGSRAANIASSARPRSVFKRKSPVPRVRYQPVSNNEDDTEDDTNAVPIGSEYNGNIHDPIGLQHEDEPQPEPEAGTDLDIKDELFFPELSEDDSHDSEDDSHDLEDDSHDLEDDSHDSVQTYNDESVEEQHVVQNEDLNALKMTELRALAKSRGVKGFSKMKKGELVALLTES
ncbi:Rho termination factor [Trifolium repens]|nr:Rho termination factor [Trifolium repens]